MEQGRCGALIGSGSRAQVAGRVILSICVPIYRYTAKWQSRLCATYMHEQHKHDVCTHACNIRNTHTHTHTHYRILARRCWHASRTCVHAATTVEILKKSATLDYFPKVWHARLSSRGGQDALSNCEVDARRKIGRNAGGGLGKNGAKLIASTGCEALSVWIWGLKCMNMRP
jgi:hypothetical protein